MSVQSEQDRIAQLERQVAELQQRQAQGPDLEWLRTSHFWRRTEYWSNPRWYWIGGAIFAVIFALIAIAGMNTPAPPVTRIGEAPHFREDMGEDFFNFASSDRTRHEDDFEPGSRETPRTARRN